jgi:peroxiredoxin
MISVGDEAPEFTAPLANGEVADITLSDAVSDGPVVLAFFPGAFTSVCSHEMESFDDRLAEFGDAGVTVYGVSIDTPFAQNAFRKELGLSFALVSDSTREIIDAYGISMDFTALGVHNLAKRAVFVVDEDRTVTYAWVSDDPGVEPDYGEVVAAARDTAGHD